MRHTDYKQVRRLAKAILTEDKKMVDLTEGLSASLHGLKTTFRDDGFDQVEAYTNGLLRKLDLAQKSFKTLADELIAYADILKAAKDGEKKALDQARSAAVKAAWEQEAARVEKGMGTRDWSVSQQAELLKHGSVTGFEGQHMLNVADHPEFAADPNNIQFLTPQEHLHGAHGGKWHNPSGGRFDPATRETIPFGQNEPPSMPEIELSQKYDPAQSELLEQLGRPFGYGRREDSQASRERVFRKDPKDD